MSGLYCTHCRQIILFTALSLWYVGDAFSIHTKHLQLILAARAGLQHRRVESGIHGTCFLAAMLLVISLLCL